MKCYTATKVVFYTHNHKKIFWFTHKQFPIFSSASFCPSRAALRSRSHPPGKFRRTTQKGRATQELKEEIKCSRVALRPRSHPPGKFRRTTQNSRATQELKEKIKCSRVLLLFPRGSAFLEAPPSGCKKSAGRGGTRRGIPGRVCISHRLPHGSGDLKVRFFG